MYLRLREHSAELDGPPVTVRQLESLVRLAEARARLDLREVVTEDDARVRMGGTGGRGVRFLTSLCGINDYAST